MDYEGTSPYFTVVFAFLRSEQPRKKYGSEETLMYSVQIENIFFISEAVWFAAIVRKWSYRD